MTGRELFRAEDTDGLCDAIGNYLTGADWTYEVLTPTIAVISNGKQRVLCEDTISKVPAYAYWVREARDRSIVLFHGVPRQEIEGVPFGAHAVTLPFGGQPCCETHCGAECWCPAGQVQAAAARLWGDALHVEGNGLVIVHPEVYEAHLEGALGPDPAPTITLVTGSAETAKAVARRLDGVLIKVVRVHP